MRIEKLLRYPVKGLGPERLACVDIEAAGSIPCDRAFAIAHGATEFDPQAPTFLGKQHFLMLMKNPRLAALGTASRDECGEFSVSFPDSRTFDGCLHDESDRRRLEALLADFIGEESRGGPPRIVSAGGHRFFDTPEEFISLINLQSVAELGSKLDMALDPLRFRGNLYVSGLAAWKEKDLVGATLVCDGVEMRVVREISRCKATCVNPDTAEVDVNIPFELRRLYDTVHMGLYLTVDRGGRLCAGSAVRTVRTV